MTTNKPHSLEDYTHFSPGSECSSIHDPASTNICHPRISLPGAAVPQGLLALRDRLNDRQPLANSLLSSTARTRTADRPFNGTPLITPTHSDVTLVSNLCAAPVRGFSSGRGDPTPKQIHLLSLLHTAVRARLPNHQFSASTRLCQRREVSPQN